MKISEFYIGKVITANNGYQYTLSEPIGKNYHSEFTPYYTPQEMLQLGVFEGKYLNDDINEYPEFFYANAIISSEPNPECNYFKIKSRVSLKDWQANGWIHQQDQKGWFQWYCRYYIGRRTEDDTRQIKRWKAFKRHAAQIEKNCPGELNKRLKQRQALLQWSYNPFI